MVHTKNTLSALCRLYIRQVLAWDATLGSTGKVRKVSLVRLDGDIHTQDGRPFTLTQPVSWSSVKECWEVERGSFVSHIYICVAVLTLQLKYPSKPHSKEFPCIEINQSNLI